MITALGALLAAAILAATPIVEVEDVVATYTSADNGAGPLWCYGAPLIARVGDEVILAGGIAIEGTAILADEHASALRARGVDLETITKAAGCTANNRVNIRWKLFKIYLTELQRYRFPSNF